MRMYVRVYEYDVRCEMKMLCFVRFRVSVGFVIYFSMWGEARRGEGAFKIDSLRPFLALSKID